MTNSSLLCPICGSTHLRERPFQYLFQGRHLIGMGCEHCGAIFLHPQPAPDELKKLYDRDYFEGGDFRCGHEGSYCDSSTLQHLTQPDLLARIKALSPGRRFLEVGCAGGALLNSARELGFTVQGVELSEDASRMARETFGVPVFTGELLEAGFSDGSFDAVYMGDVIEHLSDPVKTLQEIQRILSSGGLLVLDLPSQTNTLVSRIGFFLYGAVGKRVTASLPPYHLFEYRPRSIRFLLRRCGFEIVRLRQTIISPREINLRGSLSERTGKMVFQYPNWFLTKLFHVCGDRMNVIARRLPRD
jgi:SAM-dependent methyltransferase